MVKFLSRNTGLTRGASLLDADRGTHLRIAAVAAACAIAVVLVGVNAKAADTTNDRSPAADVAVRAIQLLVLATRRHRQFDEMPQRIAVQLEGRMK